LITKTNHLIFHKIPYFHHTNITNQSNTKLNQHLTKPTKQTNKPNKPKKPKQRKKARDGQPYKQPMIERSEDHKSNVVSKISPNGGLDMSNLI